MIKENINYEILNQKNKQNYTVVTILKLERLN